MTVAAPESSVWEDAILAATLFAIDPAGLGGVAVRGGPAPPRDAWMSVLKARLAADAPVRRAPLHIEDDRLLGGLDLAASLAAGRPIAQRGVLAESDGGVVILPMAERMDDATAARLSSALDRGEIAVEREGLAERQAAHIGVVALDDGAEPDEHPPAALLERLAFRLDLSGLPARGVALDSAPEVAAVAQARARLPKVKPPPGEIIEALCATAQMLGVGSARAPILALRAARALAALDGRGVILAEDAALAARLVLGPRALHAPADPEAQSETPPESDPPPPDNPPDAQPPTDQQPLNETDLIIAAIQAALPEDLLASLKPDNGGRARPARARGEGAKAKSARRGRPVGTRPGARRSGDRLNLVETLRAATPWQKLRGGGLDSGRVQVRQEDFRIRRFVQRTESTTIFVVDASGSAAFQRLAEAKGAVELLLAKAYVTRTRVALIAFRGLDADILLPPTRSLTRAKRRLADLPGGGGTPLAAGIEIALRLALLERAADRAPLLVFLTDGRANIGRDGAPGRHAAETDALLVARLVRDSGIAAAYIDTSARPQPGGDRFALAMGAAYAPLPYLNAGAVQGVVDALRPGAR